MRDETGDLVPELLARDASNLVTDPLVGVEVKREAGVVPGAGRSDGGE